MDIKLNKFFDELQRISERIHSGEDNEAIRHDLLVRPILTSPFGLGWEEGEVLSQVQMNLQNEIIDSYYWRGASPKKRRPDIILVPYNITKVVGVVEEKRLQIDIEKLETYTGQLLEYQYLHNCVWGLLTDGEKWILTKNHEVFQRFENLSDLKLGIKDLRNCIGKEAILERMIKFGTTDIVFVRPSYNLILMSIPGVKPSITNLDIFLNAPSKEGHDLIIFLYESLQNKVSEFCEKIPNEFRSFLSHFFGSGLNNNCGVVSSFLDLALYCEEHDKESYEEILPKYTESKAKFIDYYPIYQIIIDKIENDSSLTPQSIIEMCAQTNYYLPLRDLPFESKKNIKDILPLMELPADEFHSVWELLQ